MVRKGLSWEPRQSAVLRIRAEPGSPAPGPGSTPLLWTHLGRTAAPVGPTTPPVSPTRVLGTWPEPARARV